LQQRIVKAVLIEKDARLLHHVELAQREDLHDFLERAPPARQRDERVRPRFHEEFSFPHRDHRDHLVGLVVGEFAGLHEFRNHADHPAARLLHRPAHRAHQPGLAAAVDEAPAAVDHRAAQLGRHRGIFRVKPVARRTVNAKQFGHGK